MRQHPDQRVLAESDRYVLLGEFEASWRVDKRTAERCPLGEHYGDPSGGVITPDGSWGLVVGEGVVYFDARGARREFWRSGDRTRFVHAVRLEGVDKAWLLVEPWSPASSVWEFDATEVKLRKVRDAPEYVSGQYRESLSF